MLNRSGKITKEQVSGKGERNRDMTDRSLRLVVGVFNLIDATGCSVIEACRQYCIERWGNYASIQDVERVRVVYYRGVKKYGKEYLRRLCVETV